MNPIRQRMMEKAVIKRAKFTSPGCLEYVYLSGRVLDDSMISILINENVLWLPVCTDDGFCLKSVSEGDVSTVRKFSVVDCCAGRVFSVTL